MKGKCVASFNFSRENFSITNDIKMTSQLFVKMGRTLYCEGGILGTKTDMLIYSIWFLSYTFNIFQS